MSELPAGWVVASLDAIVSFSAGGMWGSAGPGEGDVRVRVIRGAEFRDWLAWRGRSAPQRFVPVSGLASRQLELGDLILEVSGGGPTQPVGRTVRIDEQALSSSDAPLICSNFCRRLVLTPEVDPRYVWYQLQHGYARNDTDQFQRATTNIRNLQVTRYLEGTQLNIAPRTEQERIVGAIEEEFSRLDAGIAALERARQGLMRLKAAVLRAAYDDAAEECGTSSLTAMIGDKALFVDGDWVESKDQDPDGDHRLTQLADVGDGTWRNRSARFMSNEQFTRLGCTELQKGDILVARMPAPLGRACLFPGDPMPCATVVDVAIIRLSNHRADPRWLMWILNSPQIRAQVSSLAKGTTRTRISRRNLGAVQIPRLNEEAQRASAQELESRLDAIARMEETIAVTSVCEARLRSSLLATAFDGRLVSQDPANEPASVLLAGTAADRASSNGHKPTRARKPPRKVRA